jgi:hypothetical protein
MFVWADRLVGMRGGKAPARRVDAYLFAKTWRLFDTGREVDAHQLADILEISMRTSWLVAENAA